MQFKLSLFHLFAIATCLILLAIAMYERNRAAEIEARSFLITKPEYRAIIEQDWEIFKREVALQCAIEALDKNRDLSAQLIPRDSQQHAVFLRQLVNLRNSKLKLAREKSNLKDMRKTLVRNASNLSGKSY